MSVALPAHPSPAHELLVANGGWWTSEDDFAYYRDYGDIHAEYKAVREDVVAWDVSGTHSFVWEGPQAAAAAQAVFSNDILNCPVGLGRYGAILDRNGNVLDDPIAFKHSDEFVHMTMSVPHWNDYFQQMIKGFDATVRFATLEYPHVQVQGPNSRKLLQTLTDFDMESLKWFRFTTERVPVAGVDVIVTRTGPTAELGYELHYPRPDGLKLFTALVDAGATLCGHDCMIKMIKPETGAICFGVDYVPGERTPFDLGMDTCVAINKPVEFAGKSRLASLAKAPPHRLISLSFASEDLPDWGSKVMVDGYDIGDMTVSTTTPLFGALGQAIIETDFASPGTRVEVVDGDRVFPATVGERVLYDPERIRVRS